MRAMATVNHSQTNLLLNEIRVLVADAIESGECLSTEPIAARLANKYPHSGLSMPRIAEILIEAAIAAQVPLEIGRPDDGKRTSGARPS
jgi:hypothetical protein